MTRHGRARALSLVADPATAPETFAEIFFLYSADAEIMLAAIANPALPQVLALNLANRHDLIIAAAAQHRFAQH